jgi:hypothetical protein
MEPQTPAKSDNSLFSNLDLNKYGDMTVEQYLRLQCQASMDKLAQYSEQKIQEFKAEAQQRRKYLQTN